MVCTNLLEVGKMQKSKRNTLTVLLLIAITAIMCAAISVGGMLQSGMRVSAAATGWQGVSYYSDYSSQQETYEAGFALSKQLAEEGYVLLKNEVSGIAEREGAKALPLKYGQNISTIWRISSLMRRLLHTMPSILSESMSRIVR